MNANPESLAARAATEVCEFGKFEFAATVRVRVRVRTSLLA